MDPDSKKRGPMPALRFAISDANRYVPLMLEYNEERRHDAGVPHAGGSP